jgi:hypothetical protein
LSSTTIFSETVTTSISSSIDTGGGSSLFPARAGFSTAALSAAIAVPGAETFSKGKTLDQVATAARNGLDQKYASVNASGSPFDKNSPTDWNTVFGDFDRRSLYAVASNQGGNFSKDEQQAAKSVLDQQLQYAGGFFVLKSGPDPVGDAAGYAKQLSWLDGLSSDEKTSSDWAAARSSAQGLLQASLYTAVADAFYATGVDANTANKLASQFFDDHTANIESKTSSVIIESTVQSSAQAPNKASNDSDSDTPAVKVIKAAVDKLRSDQATAKNSDSDAGPSKVTGGLGGVKNQPWFKDFASRLDNAIQRNNANVQLQNSLYQSYRVSKYA